MNMVSILAMTAIVFLSRYLFLEPRVPLKLNGQALRFLSYSSPCVLTAIWSPIVFAPHGQLTLLSYNPYLLAAIAAVVLIWKTGNVLMTTLVSMVFFLVLNVVI
ncbi:AzlD domain-containing protein [Vibrio sp. JC009]|uniref:AzlD domain-containing protein n=1 Tax=Vibrio sp. JC009 TaxID=2912314 RepID=UPI0023B01FB9|nr:AzlD domain-containing protein [Vibrio sp. JC009]WED23560.1 AzlD domain-containing protein [Vibrio sp. JC009]